MTIRNKVILLLITLLTSVFSFSQGYEKMSQEELNKIPLYSKSTFGFVEDLPSSYSLEKYIPAIGDQYDSGSCVAWAFSYYGMSIIYNSSYNITSEAGKKANSFDPWFLYNQIGYLEDSPCDNGVGEIELLELSYRIGNKKMLFNPTGINCKTDWDNVKLREVVEYTKPYRFTDWEQIDPENSSSISNIKNEIVKYNYPVMIGISNYGEGLNDNMGKDGVFKPNYIEDNDGHMMTIIGYNDSINGGSFRVVNSWGEDWGDNGYMWMSYNDYRRYTDTTFTVYVSFDVEEKDGSEFKTKDYGKVPSANSAYYEGVVNEEMSYNGSGVYYWLNEDNEDEYIVGTWKDGKRNGFFLRITNDGTWYSCWEEGVFIEDCKEEGYGFASSNDYSSKIEGFELTSSKFFNETNIKADN